MNYENEQKKITQKRESNMVQTHTIYNTAHKSIVDTNNKDYYHAAIINDDPPEIISPREGDQPWMSRV